MSQSDRGEFENRDRAKQLISFQGMKYDSITPTDMDGLIEYHDECYVLMEFKYKGKELPYGQKLAFTRLADDLEKARKPTTLLICNHEVDNPDVDVIAKDAIVKQYYYKGRWYHGGNRTVKEVTDKFLDYIELLKLGF